MFLGIEANTHMDQNIQDNTVAIKEMKHKKHSSSHGRLPYGGNFFLGDYVVKLDGDAKWRRVYVERLPNYNRFYVLIKGQKQYVRENNA